MYNVRININIPVSREDFDLTHAEDMEVSIEELVNILDHIKDNPGLIYIEKETSREYDKRYY